MISNRMFVIPLLILPFVVEGFTTRSSLDAQTGRSLQGIASNNVRNPLLWMSSSDPSSDEETETNEVVKLLEKNYPSFYNLLVKNEEIRLFLQEQSVAKFTVFVPTEKAFEDLGEKKLAQLEDPRNLETTEKIAAYHVIMDSLIKASDLFREDWTVPKTKSGKPELTFKGVKTVGGEVPVGRGKKKGFLGILDGEEDGSIVVGPDAKIVKSFKVESTTTAIIHEVDSFVSPAVLWRYFDQLRIPGF